MGTIFCHRYSGYTSQGSGVGLAHPPTRHSPATAASHGEPISPILCLFVLAFILAGWLNFRDLNTDC
jgi:hypothetical protein